MEVGSAQPECIGDCLYSAVGNWTQATVASWEHSEQGFFLFVLGVLFVFTTRQITPQFNYLRNNNHFTSKIKTVFAWQRLRREVNANTSSETLGLKKMTCTFWLLSHYLILHGMTWGVFWLLRTGHTNVNWFGSLTTTSLSLLEFRENGAENGLRDTH